MTILHQARQCGVCEGEVRERWGEGGVGGEAQDWFRYRSPHRLLAVAGNRTEVAECVAECANHCATTPPPPHHLRHPHVKTHPKSTKLLWSPKSTAELYVAATRSSRGSARRLGRAKTLNNTQTYKLKKLNPWWQKTETGDGQRPPGDNSERTSAKVRRAERSSSGRGFRSKTPRLPRVESCSKRAGLVGRGLESDRAHEGINLKITSSWFFP